MITAGIDLSTDPLKTWVAVITWHDDHAALVDLTNLTARMKLTKEEALPSLIDVIENADKVGIDCPFGWPDLFVDYLNQHQAAAFSTDPPGPITGPTDREPLALRHTDHFVHDNTRSIHAKEGLTPLAVAADRIGRTAMHCADIFTAYHQRTGKRVDRAGTGKIVEVYPAASLARWEMNPKGYKGNKPKPLRALRALHDGLLRGMLGSDGEPRLMLGDFCDVVGSNDDAFDAVVAALTARAAALPDGTLLPETVEQEAAAKTEGWIHLPAGPLPDLLGPAPSA